MQASSRARIIVSIVLAVGVLSPLPSFSHGVMTVPAARSVDQPNEDYQYCFGEPECVCGEYPEAGAIVATYEAGQTISVTIDVTLTHDYNPVFRFQLCPTEEQSQHCFTSGEFATAAFDSLVGPHTYELTLPEDVVCDPCVLRWKWDYGFLSCADVRIVGVEVGQENSSWTSLKATFR